MVQICSNNNYGKYIDTVDVLIMIHIRSLVVPFSAVPFSACALQCFDAVGWAAGRASGL